MSQPGHPAVLTTMNPKSIRTLAQMRKMRACDLVTRPLSPVAPQNPVGVSQLLGCETSHRRRSRGRHFSRISVSPLSRSYVSQLLRMRRILVVRCETPWRLDRLGRSTQNMLALAQQLRDRGAGLRVLNLGGGDVDTSTPMGSMLFTIMAALGQMELEIKRERITDSVAKWRAAGMDSAADDRPSPTARSAPPSSSSTPARWRLRSRATWGCPVRPSTDDHESRRPSSSTVANEGCQMRGDSVTSSHREGCGDATYLPATSQSRTLVDAARYDGSGRGPWNPSRTTGSRVFRFF